MISIVELGVCGTGKYGTLAIPKAYYLPTIIYWQLHQPLNLFSIFFLDRSIIDNLPTLYLQYLPLPYLPSASSPFRISHRNTTSSERARACPEELSLLSLPYLDNAPTVPPVSLLTVTRPYPLPKPYRTHISIKDIAPGPAGGPLPVLFRVRHRDSGAITSKVHVYRNLSRTSYRILA